jgi:hypothetical protein
MCSFISMKRSAIVYIVPALLAVLFSCNKNNTSPSFSSKDAIGFWRGSISTGAVVAIANRADGGSSFYAFLLNLDTATAVQKFYGRYTVNNGVYHADYQSFAVQPSEQDTLSAETIQATPLYMKGVMVRSVRYDDTITGVNALDFELIKQ